jgi:hypothetical protein
MVHVKNAITAALNHLDLVVESFHKSARLAIKFFSQGSAVDEMCGDLDL